MKDYSNELRLIVGENIKYCRNKHFPGKGGMTECAASFGVSLQQWWPWELGRRLPRDDRQAKIAEFFGTTVEWLRARHDFGDDDDAGPDQVQQFAVSLTDDDGAARFFRRLEQALSHPNRGDIIVSITMKPGRILEEESVGDVFFSMFLLLCLVHLTVLYFLHSLLFIEFIYQRKLFEIYIAVFTSWHKMTRNKGDRLRRNCRRHECGGDLCG